VIDTCEHIIYGEYIYVETEYIFTYSFVCLVIDIRERERARAREREREREKEREVTTHLSGRHHSILRLRPLLYIVVFILLHICPRTTVCVHILLYICPNTTMCPLTTMCPHTTTTYVVRRASDLPRTLQFVADVNFNARILLYILILLHMWCAGGGGATWNSTSTSAQPYPTSRDYISIYTYTIYG
jgi:hypothetical protein